MRKAFNIIVGVAAVFGGFLFIYQVTIYSSSSMATPDELAEVLNSVDLPDGFRPHGDVRFSDRTFYVSARQHFISDSPFSEALSSLKKNLAEQDWRQFSEGAVRIDFCKKEFQLALFAEQLQVGSASYVLVVEHHGDDPRGNRCLRLARSQPDGTVVDE